MTTRELLRQIYITSLILRWLMVTGLDRICMLGKEEPGIAEHVDGDVIPGSMERLCVFSHYDRDNRIDDYVVYYLEQLHSLGCETVLVSTSEALDGTSVDKARRYCRRIIVRENRGYDFGSWKVGLQDAGNLSSYDALVLANDSVYGPIQDLKDVFHDMRSHGYAAWGITDSLEIRYHLQSYFLVLEKAVLDSREFTDFWDNLPHYRFKHSVIWNCEIGFSQRLLRAGFELGALCAYGRLQQEHHDTVLRAEKSQKIPGPVNSTHYLWMLLAKTYGCPFLKVELLRDNPESLQDVNQWPAVLQESSHYDPDLIRRHLARMNARP